MKTLLLLVLVLCSDLPVRGAEELLIPAELNALVPKIRGGMTIREVEALLSTAYPNVKGQTGLWSGQTGFIDYTLNGQLILSVASTTKEGKRLVDDNLLLYIVNHAKKASLGHQE